MWKKRSNMGIIGYQLLIAGIIISCSVIGFAALNRATGLAARWTITHIFMTWLMILQFGRILISWLIGLAISGVVSAIKGSKTITA